jgi:O-methyltransferase
MKPIRSRLRALRKELVPRSKPARREDLDPVFHVLHARCSKFTMTSVERMYALYQAVTYLKRAAIPGDFVECGVWRGGSSMLAALTLLELKDSTRTLYLYDTFEGMSRPTEKDVSYKGHAASGRWEERRHGEGSAWCEASIEDVRANMSKTGYPGDRLRFIKGKVEDTVPSVIPDKNSLLRLDTDWYESTRHEFEHLYPRLEVGGVLIIDDYGHWQGARVAADEYFAAHDIPIFLHRIDYTGRIAIKPGPARIA